MTDDQFLNYRTCFNDGIVDSINMINDIQPNTSWYIPLKTPLKKPTQKIELNFLKIEFLLDTGATICILTTQTWIATETYLTPFKYELKQDVVTESRTTNTQLLPAECLIKFTFLPFREHQATLTIRFATAETKIILLGLPFLQAYCKTIDTEQSCFILKYNIHNTTLLMQKPFSQFFH